MLALASPGIQSRRKSLPGEPVGAAGDWSQSLKLKWDAWSRITEVRRASDDTVLGTYAYDGMTRRTKRVVGAATVHSYYSDAWRPLEERKDGATTASAQYLWGARHRDDLVRRDRDATGGGTLDETRYVLMDYFSPASITDGAGAVKECYAFSAFGVRRILAPDFSARETSECDFEFAFQGQFHDGESGLYDYGYRYYSPRLGSWTAKDPIGDEGGLNLYGMVGNTAVNATDAYGLRPFASNPRLIPPAPVPSGPIGNSVSCTVIITLEDKPCAYCDTPAVAGRGTASILPRIAINGGVPKGGIDMAIDTAAAKAEFDAARKIPEGCAIRKIEHPNCNRYTPVIA